MEPLLYRAQRGYAPLPRRHEAAVSEWHSQSLRLTNLVPNLTHKCFEFLTVQEIRERTLRLIWDQVGGFE